MTEDEPNRVERVPNRVGVLVFVAGLIAAATLLCLGVLPSLRPPVTSPSIPGAAITALCFAVAALVPIEYRRGEETEHITLSNLVLAVALATLSPELVVVARVAGEIAANAVHRTAPIKLVTNATNAFVEAVAAAICFGSVVTLVGTDLLWVAVVAAVVLADAVSFVLVSTAIGLYTRATEDWFDSPSSFGVGVASIDAALGALAVVVFHAEPTAAVLLAAIPGMLFVGYRNHARLTAQHARLEMLATLATTLAGVEDDRQLARALIDCIVRLTGGRSGWLIVQSPGILTAVRSSDIRANDPSPTAFERTVHVAQIEALSDSGPIGSHSGDTRAASLYSASHDVMGPFLAEAAVDQLLSASVGAGGLVATISVTSGANRWDDGDRATFGTLAAQAGAALRAGDLSDRLEREMAALAAAECTDPLTELANRAAFTATLEAELATGAAVAVLELDLDRFATVNGTLGHRSGDLLLRSVSRRLRTTVRSSDLLARIGGDEFGIMVRGATAEDASRLAEGILRELRRHPFVLDGISVTVGASVGIARCPGDATDADGLLRCAHVALREAKLAQGAIRHFDSHADEFSTRRLSLTTDLAQAIDTHRLDLVWQPQFDLVTRRVIGGEALVRWTHPELGMISPSEFVPLAEEVGLIGPLTDWVLRRAIRDLADLTATGPPFRASINLSVHNLLEEDLARNVAAILATSGASPELVRFEVTETAAMLDPSATKTQLAALAALGTTISVDDFGTGYSSLAYLHDLHASEVKIDRVFTASLGRDESSESIIKAIVGLAHELGLEVVAEGIEDEDSAQQIAALGCDIGQGYHLCPPVSRDEFALLLREAPAVMDRTLA